MMNNTVTQAPFDLVVACTAVVGSVAAWAAASAPALRAFLSRRTRVAILVKNLISYKGAL